MRDLVSDSVYDDLRSDVMSMYTRGTVHYYDLLDIRQSAVAAAEHSDAGDNITVLFQCVAMQYTLGENENIDAIQMPLLMPFSEYWTCSRPAAAAVLALPRPAGPIWGAPIPTDTGRLWTSFKNLRPPIMTLTAWTVVSI